MTIAFLMLKSNEPYRYARPELNAREVLRPENSSQRAQSKGRLSKARLGRHLSVRQVASRSDPQPVAEGGATHVGRSKAEAVRPGFVPSAPSSTCCSILDCKPGPPYGGGPNELNFSYAKSEPGEGTGLSSPSRDFLRHDPGVRGWERKRPLNGKPLRASCASAHRRSGYSSPSCVPAQFGSASPDIRIVPESSKTRRRSVDTFRGSHWGQLGSYWFVVPSARDRSPTR